MLKTIFKSLHLLLHIRYFFGGLLINEAFFSSDNSSLTVKLLSMKKIKTSGMFTVNVFLIKVLFFAILLFMSTNKWILKEWNALNFNSTSYIFFWVWLTFIFECISQLSKNYKCFYVHLHIPINFEPKLKWSI